MAILTRAELEKRLSAQDIAQLGDLDGMDAETPGMVDACLADAEAEVMGYARVVVAALPDPAPEILKRLVVDVARYNLYQRHVPEDHPVAIAYRAAVETLKGIAAGRVSLGLPSGAPLGAAVGHAPPRVMTDAALAGMGP